MESLTFEFFVRLVVAMACGVALGSERILANKTAGMRTYALVSMGAALFVIVGEYVSFAQGIDLSNSDPLRMASQVIAGIGFLGAGLIILKGDHITGVTTASGIWVAAGIGIAAGFGLYDMAVLGTLLTLFVFIVLHAAEQKFRKLPVYRHGEDEDKKIP